MILGDQKPYLDSVTVIDSFANDTAAFNALQAVSRRLRFAPLSLAAKPVRRPIRAGFQPVNGALHHAGGPAAVQRPECS